MATWVTPSDASQSRSWCSPQVKVENSRLTETRLPSFGLRTQAITVFLCTSSPAQRSTITSNSALPSPVQQPTAVATRGPPALQESAMRARGNNRGCLTRPRASLWDGLTAPMKPGADRRLHHSHTRGLDRQGQVCLWVMKHEYDAHRPKETHGPTGPTGKSEGGPGGSSRPADREGGHRGGHLAGRPQRQQAGGC